MGSKKDESKKDVSKDERKEMAYQESAVRRNASDCLIA
jgi:hypothetical protein